MHFIVPHSHQVDEGTWKLKTHLTGVLVNQKQEAHAFLDLCEYPHDSNLTINVMLETLLHIKRLIKISFLVVGHTHENIDQMFSCVARRLAKNDAHTLEALKEQIKVSYTPPVLVEELS